MRLLPLLLAAAAVLGAAPVRAQVHAELEQPLGAVLVLAHRGASYDNPEHTTFAYDGAVTAGADFLECDLQLSADEVLVCVHDTTVDRTSDGTGRVDAHTLAELRALDFGSWFNALNPDRADARFVGARIVTFEEQLDRYLASPSARFHIETKAPSEYGGRMEPLLVEVLGRRGLLDTGGPLDAGIVVQSFELASLVKVKELAPSLVTAYLWAAPTPDVATGDLPDGVDIAAPVAQAVLADPTFVARAHAAGHPVHTWTVDDEPTFERLLDLGIDGIFTNRSAVLRAVIDARSKGTTPSERQARAASPPPSTVPAPASASAIAPQGELPATGGTDRPFVPAVALIASVVLVTVRHHSSRVEQRRSTRA